MSLLLDFKGNNINMKLYQSKDFVSNPAWFIFRIDAHIGQQVVDIYFVMDLPSEMLLGHEIVEDTISNYQVNQLISLAQGKMKLPKRIIVAQGDPAQEHLHNLCQQLRAVLEPIPAPYLEQLTTFVKQDIAEHFFSPGSIPHQVTDEEMEEYEDISKEDFLKSIPDSYDPCPCNSGKKYKFCCKKIFREITEAMVAAEEGDIDEALHWIEGARKIVGTTAEVACREAIVYSYFDPKKYMDLLNACLNKFPTHPRVHYIRGIELKQQHNLPEAIKAYQTAISLYPSSDQYHLNEAYNNLGTVLYESGDMIGAKSAWEKALFFIPSDKLAKYNLGLIDSVH